MRKLRLQKIKTFPKGLQWASNKPEINTMSDSEVNKPTFNTMFDSKAHAFNTWISSHLIIKHGKCPDGQQSFGIFCQNISIFSFNRRSYYNFYRCSNLSYVTVKSWHEMKIPWELFKFSKDAWYLQWRTIYTQHWNIISCQKIFCRFLTTMSTSISLYIFLLYLFYLLSLRCVFFFPFQRELLTPIPTSSLTFHFRSNIPCLVLYHLA